MSDHLGPGSYNSAQLAINSLISEMNDLEFQRLMNEESRQFMYMKSSNELSVVQELYAKEISLVRNKMKEQGLDKTSAEYFQLMMELQELEDERDTKVKQMERTQNDREKRFEAENTQLETRYNAAKADKEGLEQVQKSNIERS